MVKTERMSLQEAASICKANGIRRFKCKDFEFVMGTELHEDPKPKKLILNPKDISGIFDGMPSDDQMLFAASEGVERPNDNA